MTIFHDQNGANDETFLVLEGELRIEVGQARAADAGAVDQFTIAAGTSVGPAGAPPVDEPPPDPAALAAMAAPYGIEILGSPSAA